MAFTVDPPEVTCTDTPPSVFCNGKESDGLFAGPKLVPNMEKIEPWAMLAFGNPTGTKLSALTMPPEKTVGCASREAPVPTASSVRNVIRFIYLSPTILFGTASLTVQTGP